MASGLETRIGKSGPRSSAWRGRALLLCASALGVACAQGTPPPLPDRAPGERAPLTSFCGGDDEPRCMLPWPSSGFLQLDPTTRTGLRVLVGDDAPPRADDPSSMNRADGFSRISPILTGFDDALDPASVQPGVVRLFDAQPGAAYGSEQLLRIRLVPGVKGGANESLLVITARQVMPAASEHLVVVMDSVRRADGGNFAASRHTLLALGLTAPTTDAERAIVRYFAPARALLAQKQIDPLHVLKLWDFTTRSALDPTTRLLPMRAISSSAAKSGAVRVAVDSVSPGSGHIAAIVTGRLTGAPNFLTEQGFQGHLVYDDAGLPLQQGVHDVRFRVVVPRTSSDYPILLYGHGTGGDYSDTDFDDGLAQAGIGKVGYDTLGWTGDAIYGTVAGLTRTIEGSDRSTAHLMQALANLACIETMMLGPLGDVLALALSEAQPGTPSHHPQLDEEYYAGGSLGGTVGLVQVAVDRARLRAGVLNVPGTAWTQFIPLSIIVNLVRPLWPLEDGGALDLELQMGSSQLAWDDVDGANWVDALPGDMPPLLLQQSIGDPVLPNIGDELMAESLGATLVGVPLDPLPFLPTAAREISLQTGITQFHDTCGQDGIDICLHQFAASDSLAGQAARQQIGDFLVSARFGMPTIKVPQLCIDQVPDGSCDFRRVSP